MIAEKEEWDAAAPWKTPVSAEAGPPEEQSGAPAWDAAAPWKTPARQEEQVSLPARSSQAGGRGRGSRAGYVSPAEVYDYLRNKGVSDIHALGILANIKAESSFNPGAAGDKGASIGLFQHQGSRRRALERFGQNPYDPRQQIEYALSEPEGQQYLRTEFATPAAATAWFTKKFERPADADWRAQERIGMLPEIRARIAQGGGAGAPERAMANAPGRPTASLLGWQGEQAGQPAATQATTRNLLLQLALQEAMR